jgi:hypothetical protein
MYASMHHAYVFASIVTYLFMPVDIARTCMYVYMHVGVCCTGDILRSG